MVMPPGDPPIGDRFECAPFLVLLAFAAIEKCEEQFAVLLVGAGNFGQRTANLAHRPPHAKSPFFSTT